MWRPDNEWKCPSASSQLSVVVYWDLLLCLFPSSLYLLDCSAAEGLFSCSIVKVWVQWMSKYVNGIGLVSNCCSNHMVALLIRVWICSETHLVVL